MKYLISIVDFDYPRTFLCKLDGSEELRLYLFDEYDHDDSSITWICVQTSIDDIDRLNRGLITLESCFYGPRNIAKSGYLVRSFYGEDEAQAEFCNNISSYLKNNQTFIDEFISDDNHGALLISAIYEKPFMATVLKPEKYADPLIDASRLSKGPELFKTMVNSLPFLVETKNCCYSQTHSLVVYYEISDKKIVNEGQGQLTDEFAGNSETSAAFDALKTILDEKSSNVEIINAFKGDKNSIEKASSFISEIKKNAKDCPLEIHAIDFSDSGISQRFALKIDKRIDKQVKNRSAEVVRIIDSECNHSTHNIIAVGNFLMLDTTGRKKFKFQSINENGQKIVYSGFAKCDVSGFAVDNKGNTKYKVNILSDVLQGQFGKSNPTFSLVEILETIKSSEQLDIFKDKQ